MKGGNKVLAGKATEKIQISLHEHIFEFLKAKVGNFQSVIAEWGYNMLEGCRRYVDDPEIELFKDILEGRVSESVLLDMSSTVLGIYDQLQTLDLKANKAATYSVTAAQFKTVLESTFSAKGKRRLESLLEAAKQPHSTGDKRNTAKVVPWKDTGTVQYDMLFKEDEQYEAGPFLHMLRLQYLQERVEFLVELERQLRNFGKKSTVSAQQCLTAISKTDKAIPEDEVKRLCKSGFRMENKESMPQHSDTITVGSFLENLRRVVLRWWSPYTVIVKGVEIQM